MSVVSLGMSQCRIHVSVVSLGMSQCRIHVSVVSLGMSQFYVPVVSFVVSLPLSAGCVIRNVSVWHVALFMSQCSLLWYPYLLVVLAVLAFVVSLPPGCAGSSSLCGILTSWLYWQF